MKRGDLVRLNAKAQRRLGIKDRGLWRVLQIDEKTGRVTVERLEPGLGRARKSTWHKDWLEAVNVHELSMRFRNKIFAEKFTELQRQLRDGEISTKQYTESLNELVVAEQITEMANKTLARMRALRKHEKESLTEHDRILSYYFEHPDEIEEGLKFISKEFSLKIRFEGFCVYEARIDLLGYDKNENVMVIEVMTPSDDRVEKVKQLRRYSTYFKLMLREIYGLDKPKKKIGFSFSPAPIFWFGPNYSLDKRKKKIRFFLVSRGHLDGDVLEIKSLEIRNP